MVLSLIVIPGCSLQIGFGLLVALFQVGHKDVMTNS